MPLPCFCNAHCTPTLANLPPDKVRRVTRRSGRLEKKMGVGEGGVGGWKGSRQRKMWGSLRKGLWAPSGTATRRRRGSRGPGHIEGLLYHVEEHRFYSEEYEGVWENFTQGNSHIITVISEGISCRHDGEGTRCGKSLNGRTGEGASCITQEENDKDLRGQSR